MILRGQRSLASQRFAAYAGFLGPFVPLVRNCEPTWSAVAQRPILRSSRPCVRAMPASRCPQRQDRSAPPRVDQRVRDAGKDAFSSPARAPTSRCLDVRKTLRLAPSAVCRRGSDCIRSRRHTARGQAPAATRAGPHQPGGSAVERCCKRGPERTCARKCHRGCPVRGIGDPWT